MQTCITYKKALGPLAIPVQDKNNFTALIEVLPIRILNFVWLTSPLT